MEMSAVKKGLPKKKFFNGTTIFIIVMLFYPVAHFLLMWLGVNINSILLTFQTPVRGKLHWLPLDDLFFNYETLFVSFQMETRQSLFLASLAYFVVSCLVTLPISLFFSYFIFKKIRGSNFFKVIFFILISLLIILTIVTGMASFRTKASSARCSMPLEYGHLVYRQERPLDGVALCLGWIAIMSSCSRPAWRITGNP